VRLPLGVLLLLFSPSRVAKVLFFFLPLLRVISPRNDDARARGSGQSLSLAVVRAPEVLLVWIFFHWMRKPLAGPIHSSLLV